MSSIVTAPWFRRLLVTLGMSGAVILKDKLGVEITQETIDFLIGLAITYIASSNLNDVVTKRAVAAGVAAAAEVTEVEKAKAALAAAIEKERKIAGEAK